MQWQLFVHKLKCKSFSYPMPIENFENIDFQVCLGLKINTATTRKVLVKERISNFQIQNISIWCKRKHSTFIHSFLEKVSCSLNKYVKWKLFAFCLLTRICIEFSNRGKVFFYLKAFSYPGNTFCNSDYLNNTCYRNSVVHLIFG